MGVKRGANQRAILDRGAAVDDSATGDARRFSRILDSGFPDLLSGFGVNGDCGVMRRRIHHAIVEQWESLLPALICEGIGPNRDKAFHSVLVDLVKRAVPLKVVAPTIGQDVASCARVILQIGLRLRKGRRRRQKGGGYGERGE